MNKQRRRRVGDRLDDDEIIVVRGGRLDGAALRSDSERYHGIYGLSVFAARDISVDELAQQSPLVRFGVLTLIQVGVLRAAGFRFDPTGRNPRHLTLGFDDLDRGIETLLAWKSDPWVNPYHED